MGNNLFEPPGTLTAGDDSTKPMVCKFAYDREKISVTNLDVDDFGTLERAEGQVVWIDVNGLGDVAAVGRIGSELGFDRLCMEDVLHLRQSPKFEAFDDFSFWVLQYPVFDGEIDYEQIAIFLKGNMVVTFQAYPTNRLAVVAERLEKNRGHVRKESAPYLVYCIIDVIVDAFFPVLERNETVIENLENDFDSGVAGVDQARTIYDLKRTVFKLRKTMWCTEGMIRQTTLNETVQTPVLAPFWRDVRDHAARVVDICELERELCVELSQRQADMRANKMNEIMKVLTIIATVFMPLSFIAGVYGMNFNPQVSAWNMPELNWKWGYVFVLGLMLASTVGMWGFFYYKGWVFAPKTGSEGVENE